MKWRSIIGLCQPRNSRPSTLPVAPGNVLRQSRRLGWWKGDDNGNDTAGANNSTFMNAITFADGKVGHAFDFNGIDSKINFGNTVGNFDTNDFTVEFWIRTSAT